MLAAILAALGGIATLSQNIRLEREKLRSTMVAEASKSGNPAQTLATLKFLVKAALVEDPDCVIATLTLDDAPAYGNAVPYRADELEQVFGTPIPDGETRVDEAWKKRNLQPIPIDPPLPGPTGRPGETKEIWLHNLVAPDFKQALRELRQAGLVGDIREFNGAFAGNQVPYQGTKRLGYRHTASRFRSTHPSTRSTGRPPPMCPATTSGSRRSSRSTIFIGDGLMPGR